MVYACTTPSVLNIRPRGFKGPRLMDRAIPVSEAAIIAMMLQPVKDQTSAHGDNLLAAYLEDLNAGLILINRVGRIGGCTAEAKRLLGLSHRRPVLGRSAAHILRRLNLDPGESRLTIVQRLRQPLRDRQPAHLEVAIEGLALSLELRPLPDAGWAITIKDREHQAVGASRPDGWRDSLTGLANRPLFEIRLREALARLQRTGERFALMTVDLDRFKQVNDTLGHPVGDALLRKVAERLQATVRLTDCVARFGGDEFAVLQSAVGTTSDVENLARRIVDLVGRTYVVDGHLINIGASVGVALAPTDGSEAATLLKNADLALYRAKLDGRDMFRFFAPEMGIRMELRRQLELDLRKALALRQFELVYQPQLNLESDQLVGCEALIRWRHPERGTVSPTEFIPLAEEIGLIISIGEWVIRTACEEAARWPGDLSIAVNLSPAQFKSKKLVDTVRLALAASGLSPNRLELEITEGVLLHENDANLATLHSLRALGLRISMDDFGTGYSSLSYLRSFPFDKIKIDRSFVSGKTSNGESMAIIRAITSLGSSFGMTTVAEGVETPDQMQRIRAEGCTDVQGYLISKPIPADDLQSFFANHAAVENTEN